MEQQRGTQGAQQSQVQQQQQLGRGQQAVPGTVAGAAARAAAADTSWSTVPGLHRPGGAAAVIHAVPSAGAGGAAAAAAGAAAAAAASASAAAAAAEVRDEYPCGKKVLFEGGWESDRMVRAELSRG